VRHVQNSPKIRFQPYLRRTVLEDVCIYKNGVVKHPHFKTDPPQPVATSSNNYTTIISNELICYYNRTLSRCTRALNIVDGSIRVDQSWAFRRNAQLSCDGMKMVRMLGHGHSCYKLSFTGAGGSNRLSHAVVLLVVGDGTTTEQKGMASSRAAVV